MMETIALELEKKHQQKSARISIITHLILLLLAWLVLLPKNEREPEKENFAVTVEFIDFKPSSLSEYAHADEGAKRPKTEKVKKVETTPVKEVKVTDKPKVDIPKPTPVIEPEVVDPIVSEVLQEDSEIEAIEEEMELEDPEPDVVPEPEVEEVEDVSEEVEEIESEEETASTPAEESDASEGDSSTNPSQLEGEEGGSGKGNQGDGPGASSGEDGDEGTGDAGTGTGDFDGSGDGIFGRKVIYRNLSEAIESATQSGNGVGKVVAKVCINKMGIPTYAEIDEYETTFTDPSVLKKFLQAMQGYRYEKDRNAPDEQCGRLVFNLDIQLKKEMASFKLNADGDMKRALKGGAELNRFKRKYKGLTPQELKNLTVNQYKKLFKK